MACICKAPPKTNECDAETTEKVSKLINVPMYRPGFDALGITAPMLVQLNPDGKWENRPPEDIDEEKLKAVVQYLVSSNAVNAAQSYCCQCAAESQKQGGAGASNYIPIVMMPIYPADQCPFDMDCEIKKIKDAEKKQEDRKTKKVEQADAADKKDDVQRKTKKRGFVMQRLTNFDLLSQW